jgi:hypothetical protein
MMKGGEVSPKKVGLGSEYTKAKGTESEIPQLCRLCWELGIAIGNKLWTASCMGKRGDG